MRAIVSFETAISEPTASAVQSATSAATPNLDDERLTSKRADYSAIMEDFLVGKVRSVYNVYRA